MEHAALYVTASGLLATTGREISESNMANRRSMPQSYTIANVIIFCMEIFVDGIFISFSCPFLFVYTCINVCIFFLIPRILRLIHRVCDANILKALSCTFWNIQHVTTPAVAGDTIIYNGRVLLLVCFPCLFNSFHSL